jgi:prepilin-type N-terminal cleavage/methylation domain-containing protein
MSKSSCQSSCGHPRCRARLCRFTLIELLVVVSIIAILASMLLPALSVARHRSKRVVCVSNMQQIGMMCLFYSEDNEGYYPPT